MSNLMQTWSKKKDAQNLTDFSGYSLTLSRFSYDPILLRVEGLLQLLTSSTSIKFMQKGVRGKGN